MPFVRRGSTFRRRGMGAAGQTDPCACQYKLPGVTLIAGLPLCDPTTGTAPGCSAAEGNAPFCGGIPYGQPGYADCISAAEATTTVGAIGPSQIVSPASYNAILASLPPPPAAPSAPAQSNAPSPAPVSSSSSAPAQSNAPAPSYASTPVLAMAPGCFGFFSGEPCLGPVGLYSLLAAGGVVFGAMALMGGHR